MPVGPEGPGIDDLARSHGGDRGRGAGAEEHALPDDPGVELGVVLPAEGSRDGALHRPGQGIPGDLQAADGTGLLIAPGLTDAIEQLGQGQRRLFQLLGATLMGGHLLMILGESGLRLLEALLAVLSLGLSLPAAASQLQRPPLHFGLSLLGLAAEALEAGQDRRLLRDSGPPERFPPERSRAEGVVSGRGRGLIVAQLVGQRRLPEARSQLQRPDAGLELALLLLGLADVALDSLDLAAPLEVVGLQLAQLLAQGRLLLLELRDLAPGLFQFFLDLPELPALLLHGLPPDSGGGEEQSEGGGRGSHWPLPASASAPSPPETASSSNWAEPGGRDHHGK